MRDEERGRYPKRNLFTLSPHFSIRASRAPRLHLPPFLRSLAIIAPSPRARCRRPSYSRRRVSSSIAPEVPSPSTFSTRPWPSTARPGRFWRLLADEKRVGFTACAVATATPAAEARARWAREGATGTGGGPSGWREAEGEGSLAVKEGAPLTLPPLVRDVPVPDPAPACGGAVGEGPTREVCGAEGKGQGRANKNRKGVPHGRAAETHASPTHRQRSFSSVSPAQEPKVRVCAEGDAVVREPVFGKVARAAGVRATLAKDAAHVVERAHGGAPCRAPFRGFECKGNAPAG